MQSDIGQRAPVSTSAPVSRSAPVSEDARDRAIFLGQLLILEEQRPPTLSDVLHRREAVPPERRPRRRDALVTKDVQHPCPAVVGPPDVTSRWYPAIRLVLRHVIVADWQRMGAIGQATSNGPATQSSSPRPSSP